MLNKIMKYKFEVFVLLTAVLVAFTISRNIVVVEVDGNSMFPTYEDGDVALMKKSSKKEIDSIVIFNSPREWGSEERMFIKRLVGVSGDTIKIKNNNLIRNGEVIANIEKRNCEDVNTITIPEGYFFAVGDNHGNSKDSLTKLCQNENFLVKEERVVAVGKPFTIN